MKDLSVNKIILLFLAYHVSMLVYSMSAYADGISREELERSHKLWEIKTFHINGDGTVTDTETGLMWKQCSEGQSGKECRGEAAKYKGTDLDKLSKKTDSVFAGYSDWRIPNNDELSSLVSCSNGKLWVDARDDGCGHWGKYQRPTIYLKAFPNTPSTIFWSSSSVYSVYGTDSYAWGVDFSSGYDDWDFRFNSFPIRLVRGGKGWPSLPSIERAR